MDGFERQATQRCVQRLTDAGLLCHEWLMRRERINIASTCIRR